MEQRGIIKIDLEETFLCITNLQQIVKQKM